MTEPKICIHCSINYIASVALSNHNPIALEIPRDDNSFIINRRMSFIIQCLRNFLNFSLRSIVRPRYTNDSTCSTTTQLRGSQAGLSPMSFGWYIWMT